MSGLGLFLAVAVVPVFTVWQVVRLRRALHVFQLEGYKRPNFLRWCTSNRGRALFMSATPAKKPLVMTGRARRILVTAATLSLVTIYALMAVGGAVSPAAVVGAWAAGTAFVFFATAQILVAADWLLGPVQAAVNRKYERAARRKLDEIRPLIVGITGSFGKTSTKFTIEALIGPHDEVLATPESFNTPLGVCRTINEHLLPGHRYFVVEMGARRRGDIAELCALVPPNIAVLTAVGPAHLETLGSIEGVAATKYEIVEGAVDSGVAVMNTDNPYVRSLADRTTRVRVVRYGLLEEGRPDLIASDVEVTPRGAAFTITDVRSGDTLRAQTQLLGRHAIGNVLAGVAVAREVGRPLGELAASIGDLKPVEHRLQIIVGAGGVTVIDDAYNSNPEGAAAALEVVAAMPARRRIVVTPGMIELGTAQAEANAVFGERASKVADVLIVVSRVNREALLVGAARAGHAEVVAVDTLAAARESLKGLVGPGDVVLFENDLPDHYEG